MLSPPSARTLSRVGPTKFSSRNAIIPSLTLSHWSTVRTLCGSKSMTKNGFRIVSAKVYNTDKLFSRSPTALHYFSSTLSKMSDDLITAYPNAVPKAQEQPAPGLDAKMLPSLEYTKQERWDDSGKPSLVEYKGSDKLTKKTAIVTGGDSGIGRSAAIMFAMEGATGITITYLPAEQKDADDAKKQIETAGKSFGTQVLLVKTDLQSKDNCKDLVEQHMKKFGKLDILVNNASTQSMCANFEEIELDGVQRTFQTNIISMMSITKFALPHLKRGASIINTTSVTAYAGSPAMVDYSSTKGAIVSFTRALAQQLAPKGIRVNGIAPGPVLTALQAASRPADNMEEWGTGVPLHKRAGQPAELGPSYVFLASSDANLVTGAVIHINSGKHTGGS